MINEIRKVVTLSLFHIYLVEKIWVVGNVTITSPDEHKHLELESNKKKRKKNC